MPIIILSPCLRYFPVLLLERRLGLSKFKYDGKQKYNASIRFYK